MVRMSGFFFFQYDRAKNIRPIWCIVLSNNPVPLLGDAILILHHTPSPCFSSVRGSCFSLLEKHFQESVAKTKGKQKENGR